MSIIIKLAETPAERNACLRLRHKVFVEADARFEPRPDSCLMDRFDCCGTSVLMVALVVTMLSALQAESRCNDQVPSG